MIFWRARALLWRGDVALDGGGGGGAALEGRSVALEGEGCCLGGGGVLL